MMQQLASNKPDSAASALPLDISRSSRTNDKASQSFNQVLREESARPSAFEQARKNAADRTSSNTASVQRDKPVSNEPASNKNTESSNRQDAQDKALNAGETDSARQTRDRVTEQKRDEQSPVGVKAASNTENKEANKTQSTAVTKSDIVDDTGKAPSNKSSDEEFDYIDYVSEFALLSDKAALGQEEGLEDKLIDLTKIISLNVDDADKQDIPLTSADLAAQTQDNIDGLLQLGIDKSQLQTILDAQNAQLDLNSELNEAEQIKLQTIIANMLNTLQSESNEQGLDHESLAKVKKADEALLEQLLLHPAKSEQADKYKIGEQAGLPIEQYPKETDGRLTSIENAAKTPKVVKNHEYVVSPVQTLDKQALLDSKGKKELEDIGKPELDPAAGLKISDKDIWRKTPELNDISKLPDNTLKTNTANTQTAKPALDNIALLNDEQNKLAMNNLQERVQSVIADLKTEGKGNEFIAALQSGVKEFKQQLAQGREPGINLKDMVAEALSAAGVEVDKSVQAKVDNSVSQFNAVLNLANAVNYSANQQQAQVLGITDNQLAKEINHQQIEGTKLANASTNASNQAMFDKAVNIYKAEGQAQLAEKVRWMVNSKNSSAEIRLDPPDLGAVNIKVNLSGDAAQVNFTVQSQAAKEALDQAVPRLRDMLQQQGIELGQSSVQQDNPGQQGAEQQGEFAQGGQNSGASMTNNESSMMESQDFAQGHIEQRVSNGRLGGIDYYA